jgi:2-dehydropantoate 2-reductase
VALVRYIIYGAGAVGGSIGARLFQAGRDVVLIARGPHLNAIQRDGLTVLTADREETVRVPAVGHPSEIEWREDDLVLLTVKSQHTAGALDDLAAVTGDVPFVCAQNGVANERMALRRFSRVYAMMVMLPATHLEPGVVLMNATPVGGLLDIGCFPSGADSACELVARDLTQAGLHARVDPNVMRLKYGKLVENLANAVQALCGLESPAGELVRAVRAEGVAVLQAAGIDFATESEMDERRAESMIALRPIEGQGRGGSTWQSLERGSGSVETDYLNGEIALLGALHGIPTPYNRTLQRLTAQAAREGRPPGSYTADELLDRAAARP